MEYKIIRTDRKTLAITIKNGELIVRAPRRLGDAKIRDFVSRHTAWIDKHMAAVKAKEIALEDIEPMTEAEMKELRARAKDVFAERVAYYASLLGVSYGKVSVRCQKTRWGSCNREGDLSLNCLLLLAPSEVLDSVVAHELCHRKYMNHSNLFYEALYSVFPNYDECRRWLKENGEALWHRVDPLQK